MRSCRTNRVGTTATSHLTAEWNDVVTKLTGSITDNFAPFNEKLLIGEHGYRIPLITFRDINRKPVQKNIALVSSPHLGCPGPG